MYFMLFCVVLGTLLNETKLCGWNIQQNMLTVCLYLCVNQILYSYETVTHTAVDA